MNMNVRKAQGGFTLIELVIIIVLLGLLAAVALPRYLDLSDEALTASCDGVFGAVLSQAAINVADPDIGDGIGSPGSIADAIPTLGGGAVVTEEGTGVDISIDGTDCPDNTYEIPAELRS